VDEVKPAARVPTVEHRKPCEPRGSRTVLGAPGGEIPPGDSPGTILESFAEREGDVDAGIAIRAKDISTAYAYLGIAQLCLSHGRDAEALKWAEEGLWQFEDQLDQRRLVLFSADLYRRIGREKDADELLWQTFDRLPRI
jgi:hypothetical protein